MGWLAAKVSPYVAFVARTIARIPVRTASGSDRQRSMTVFKSASKPAAARPRVKESPRQASS
jgi:hypothetical protein